MQSYKKKQNISESLPLYIGILLLFISAFLFVTGYETSQDAVVEGHLISVLSRVKGPIVNVYIEDGQEVKKGDLLMEIEPTVYQANLRAAEAELNNAKVKLILCEKPDRDEIIISDESQKQQQSLIDSKYIFNRNDLDKFAKMFAGNVQKRRDKTKPEKPKPEPPKDNTNLNPNNPLPNLQQNAEEEVNEEDMIDTVELRSRIKELESRVADCKLELSYTKIYATQDGIISSRNVQEGDTVDVGQELVNIIPKHVWITANYKTSQSNHIHEGQSAIIRLDNYPHKFFKGVVENVDSLDFYNPKKQDQNNDKPKDTVPVRIVFTKDYSEFNIVPGICAKTSVKVK